MVELVIPEFKGEHYFLSNFHYHDQVFPAGDRILKFPTAEHVFQACKYKAMNASDEDKYAYVDKIRSAHTPTEARKLGRSAQGLDVAHWDGIKVDVMRAILLNKFTDPDLEARLKATGHAMLVEGNTWGDTFWGRCDKKGYNILGVLLMELRGYFRMCNQSWPVS